MQLRTASNLTGPWSSPVSIYTIPSTFLAEGSFCYAGITHLEFSNDDSVVITFNCNTQGLAPLLSRPNMYIPQVIRVDLQKVVEMLKRT